MPLPFVKKAAEASKASGYTPPPPTPPPDYRTMKGQAPGVTADLRRVLALPKRDRPDDATLKQWAAEFKARFGKKVTSCECRSRFKRPCCSELLPVQAWALKEAELYGGILGPIGVGHGKTLLDLLTPMVVGAKRALLLLPPNLKHQMLEQDWHYYGQHWQLPNLSGPGKMYYPGLPFLYVVAFSELSGAKSTTLLHDLNPDVVVVDEAHSVRNRTAARTKRFLRFLKDKPDVRLFSWSGTLTSRSLHDYAHLSAHALRDGSPTPLHWPTVEEWASHLDPGDLRTPPGALAQLDDSNPRTDDAREGFKRRLVATPGVISSGDAASCQASLTITERELVTPEVVKQHLRTLEATWQRPDGEELVDGLSVARCARELSCGFYYRWRWPRGERVEVIEAWLTARKEWHKELREKLKTGRAHMDSPLLCTKAAIRWYEGYTHVERDVEGREIARRHVPPHTSSGPLPTWEALHWPRWKEVRDTAKPETEAIWLDDFLVNDCLDWLAEGPGLLWYEFGAVASRILQSAKGRNLRLAYAGPGDEGNKLVSALTGSEAVVASIRAHGTGKNLQAFSRNLVANPPADGATWEQLIGRTHRQGQEEDEVTFDIYRHTEAFANAVDRARDLSDYIEGTFGTNQKLTSVARWVLSETKSP